MRTIAIYGNENGMAYLRDYYIDDKFVLYEEMGRTSIQTPKHVIRVVDATYVPDKSYFDTVLYICNYTKNYQSVKLDQKHLTVSYTNNLDLLTKINTFLNRTMTLRD